MARINTVGVLVVDALSGPLPHYPVPGKHSQVNTEWLSFMPGGGAANTGGALGKMGLGVGIFSKAGKDFNGDFVLRELKKSGVDTSGIRISEKDTTPFTYVSVWPNGDRTFVHTPGANMTFSKKDIDIDSLLDADYLLYQDFWVLPKLDGRDGRNLLKLARKKGVVTLLDECWGLGPKRGIFEEMLPFCDYVLPSLDDMKVIYPGLPENKITDHLLAKGAGTVVLKMGARGCLLCHGQERILVPAFAAKVVDTTGAGDCWDAGFIAALAHGEETPMAARIGNACASFCVGAIGGTTGVPDYSAVKRRALGK